MQFIKFTIFAIHLFTAVSAGAAGTCKCNANSLSLTTSR